MSWYTAIFGSSTASNMVVDLPKVTDESQVKDLSEKVEKTIHESGLKGSKSVTVSTVTVHAGPDSRSQIHISSNDLDRYATDRVLGLTQKAIIDAKKPLPDNWNVFSLEERKNSSW